MGAACKRVREFLSKGRRGVFGAALTLGLLVGQQATAEPAQAPLFVAKYVPGNLALVPSVEWPTILSMANLGNYTDATVYTGYFDAGKCYRYQNSGAATSHFYPVSLTGNRRCTTAGYWSGNYLNWATTQTIDPFRSALTGGYRVIDTPTETVLEKARHTGQSETGRRSLSGATAVNRATGAVGSSTNWAAFFTRIDGLGNRMYFSRRNNDLYGSPTVVHYNPSTHDLSGSTADNTVYEVYVRVRVCDEAVGLEANCRQYSQGYKPEGLIQEYSQQIRYSVFGYLNDHDQQRDGGVLRANQKFVGPIVPLPGGGEESNPNAEWDADTGVFVVNPNPDDATATQTYFGTTVSNSGVINYLNKFGQLTNNNHKSNDPVSELFYTAIRYFKNLGCVPEYATRYPTHNSAPNAATRAQWVDGFPVIRDEDWQDPIEHRCQKNVILGIGDTNTHADRNLPGAVRNSGREPTLPGAVSGDDTVNVRTATERLELLEGVGLNAGNTTELGTCCSNNSAYIAGLAYDSHAGDIRPEAEMPGRQSVSTYWVDVRENGVLRGPSTNQYWLAAKYGGFLVPENYLPYERTEALPDSWWSDGDTLATDTQGAQARPRNFFVASDAAAMVASLRSAFANIVADMQASSSSVAANSTRLDTETLIYQASFNARDWSGRIRAFSLNPGDGSIDEMEWDTNASGTFALPDARNIFTASGTPGTTTTTGIDFSWLTLPSAQQGMLQPSDTRGQDRLNWLRGVRTQEGAGGLRERNYLLGDVVNSDPAFVGRTEDFGYSRLAGDEGSSYGAFLTSKASRRSMLYVGSNAGMLHGFDASAGQEIFAYVPLGVFPNLHELTAPDYQHRYYVDGSPRAGDAYIGGSWRTVLLGSTGAGGRSVFALDVSNPDSMGSNRLMWEFSTDAADEHQLGFAMSQPVLARVEADVGGGTGWVAIFGNGYETGASAKLFVVNLSNGNLVTVIEVGEAGEAGVLNGLSSVVPVDINNDRITDYVYAGDLQGNMWRFDLTGAAVAGWSASRLFHAVDGSEEASPQAITSRPAVGRHPEGGLMVYFGTGKYFEPGDATVAEDPQIQTFYGIRDLNGAEVERGSLREQSIIFEGPGVLSEEDGVTELTEVSVRAVSNVGGDTAPASGWLIDLVPPSGLAQGERVVSTPIVRFGRIIFTSIIPTEDPCDFGGTSWLMELDAVTGGRLIYSVIDVNNDGEINEADFITLPNGERVPVSGKSSGEMIDTPGIVGAGEVEYKYTSGSSGTIGVIRERGASDVLGRQSWRQLR